MIEELREKLDKDEVTSEELFNEALKKAHQYQEEYNSFVTIMDQYKIKKRADNILTGIPYALKDNFSTSGI